MSPCFNGSSPRCENGGQVDSGVVSFDFGAKLQFVAEQGLATVATWDRNGDGNCGDYGGSGDDHEDDGEGDDEKY